jgi:hypothetical protein
MINKHLIMALLLLPMVCNGGPPISRIELTQQDPGNRTNWTSSDVSVLGLWLGQSRKDAVQAMRNRSGELWPRADHKIQLMGPCIIPRCDLFVLNMPARTSVDFDDADSVSGIAITWHGEYVSAIATAPRLRGELGELLRNYSEAQRLKLFGEAERAVDDPPIDQNFITYFYDTRGISVRVQRATDSNGSYGRALVILCLYRPNGTSCAP